MQSTQNTYPVFEANQVLTNAHLNQIFNYLDEQERLTRANLIGIGIVCGLEIRHDTSSHTIHLSKGCGITSAGYLIVEPEDVALVAYRTYVLPEDVGYNNLMNSGTNPRLQYPLWELFPAGSPNVSPLNTPANFLTDKAVLLFLELNKEGLRNCSPNNCDDKGARVVSTVRRLLISTSDLNRIIAEANQLASGSTTADLEASLLARLNLPDLKLPRYNVINTNPATSNDVLAAFLAIFRTGRLAENLGNALVAAYQAFAPVLRDVFGTNPFSGFAGHFQFLDTVPATTDQVLFLQYYVDFFDDLLNAYEEFRWKGIELLCACCPPEGLFPRHLMLGILSSGSGIYRHRFLASSAVSGCGEHEKDLQLLFRRLVEMVEHFTNNPALPAQAAGSKIDTQIRITPSKLTHTPLSGKAIPYYYEQTGTPPLFQLWNARYTRHNRANQNLGYRSGEYNPAAPAFVTNALLYDLEPYNFLRIEGHLGKNYQSVLTTLLTLKTQYRLPIEVIALRTGAFDENIPVDLSKEEARFQDLETLYDAFREDLLRTLTEGVLFLYDTPIPKSTDPGGTPRLPLLRKYAPLFRHHEGTVGAWFEKNLDHIQAKPYIDVDQDNIDATSAFMAYCIIFYGTATPPPEFQAHIVSVYYLVKLSEIVPQALNQLAFADFRNKYQDLLGLTRFFRNVEKDKVPAQLQEFIPREELIDYFNQVLYNCRLDAVAAIHEEFVSRIRKVKQKQFFSYFLRNHPGIQHKAGVPAGGTFIIVYHDDPEPVKNTTELVQMVQLVREEPLAFVETQTADFKTNKTNALLKAIKNLRKKIELFSDPDIQTIYGELTGQVPNIDFFPGKIEQNDPAEKIIREAVNGLADGTVIADFFLPYLCCSDGSAVQFVLPRIPPTFTVQVKCTGESGAAEVVLTPTGGLAPYSIKTGSQGYKPLTGALLLPAGTHTLTIKDAEGTESAVQTIEIPNPLALGKPNIECIGDKNEYIITFSVSGGTPPYSASKGNVEKNQFTSHILPGDTDNEIVITDKNNCKIIKTANYSCLPPLTFTTKTGCTTKENVAPVYVIPAGGEKPYQVRVGSEEFRDITGDPLPLPAGSHTLVVRDKKGTHTAGQVVLIPPALIAFVFEYNCEGAATYRARITIQGGTPPYFVNDKEVKISDNKTYVYESDPVPSGHTVTLQVKDKNGCAEPVVLQHTCVNPCDLPCDGAAVRCGYRFWLPEPDKERQKTFQSLGFEVPVFTFEFPPGKLVDLRAEVEDIIQEHKIDEINNNFDGVALGWIERINKLIINRTGNPNWLKLSYTRSPSGSFGVVLIEHFKCLSFNFHVQAFFQILSVHNRLETVYLPEGTTLKTGEDKPPRNIPAFNCVDMDKCHPEIPEKQRCQKIDLSLNIIKVPGENKTIILKAESSGEDVPATYLWEVEDGIPATSNKQEEHFSFRNFESVFKNVRLSAFTDKGCMVTVEDKIDFNDQ